MGWPCGLSSAAPDSSGECSLGIACTGAGLTLACNRRAPQALVEGWLDNHTTDPRGYSRTESEYVMFDYQRKCDRNRVTYGDSSFCLLFFGAIG